MTGKKTGETWVCFGQMYVKKYLESKIDFSSEAWVFMKYYSTQGTRILLTRHGSLGGNVSITTLHFLFLTSHNSKHRLFLLFSALNEEKPNHR